MYNSVSKPRIPPTSLKTFTPEIEIDNVVCTVTTKQGTGSAFSTSGDIVENKEENTCGRISEENERTADSANALQGIFSMCKFSNLPCASFEFRLNCSENNSVKEEGFVPTKDGTLSLASVVNRR